VKIIPGNKNFSDISWVIAGKLDIAATMRTRLLDILLGLQKSEHVNTSDIDVCDFLVTLTDGVTSIKMILEVLHPSILSY